jgi:hypothetical protein
VRHGAADLDGPALLQTQNSKAGSMPDVALTLARYRFRFRALETVRFPPYAGSAWRGLFGRSLKRTVCVTREPDCRPCLLLRSCPYPEVFETHPPNDAADLRRYHDAPHPYVLRPDPRQPRTVEPGAGFELELVLVGRAIGYLPYLVQTFRTAGEQGLGRAGARFAVAELAQARGGGWQTIYAADGVLKPLDPEPVHIPPPPEGVRLIIDTPLRLRRDGELVTPRTFAFHDLLRNLLRRVSMLSQLHTDRPLAIDYPSLSRAAREIELRAKDLRWWDWKRYSSRQRTELAMGGVVGSIVLAASELGPFWPYLWLGQWVHAGKGAVMGLGRYRMEAASLPDRTPV